MITIKARAAQQRYRAKHKRVDYAPSPEALTAIEQHAWRGNRPAVIDWLIIKGSQAVTAKAAS